MRHMREKKLCITFAEELLEIIQKHISQFNSMFVSNSKNMLKCICLSLVTKQKKPITAS